MIKQVLSLMILSSSIALTAQAKDPELSYYIFENKGTASSGKMLLENKDNPVKVPAAWFDYNCVAQKQKDGVLMDCRRGNEFVETKVYCNLPQAKFGRLVRLGKGENFVTFEARCNNKVSVAPHHAKKKAPLPTVPAVPAEPVPPGIDPTPAPPR